MLDEIGATGLGFHRRDTPENAARLRTNRSLAATSTTVPTCTRSLGIVLCELATGRRPFEGATATATAFQRLYADPPAASKHAAVSPAFDRLIGRALARDSEDRLQAGNELAAALRPLAEDPGADTQPLTAVTSDASAPPASRRNRGVLTGGLLTTLMLAGALLVGPQLWGPPYGQVPDLSGTTISAAADLLDQHGLEVGDITRRVSEQPAGTVIGQDPPAGSNASDDGSMYLIVALPPSASPSPAPDATPTSETSTSDRAGNR